MVWVSMEWYGGVWSGMGEYRMVWWSMEWYGGVWNGMVEYGMVWVSMEWYGGVWSGMAVFKIKGAPCTRCAPFDDRVHRFQYMCTQQVHTFTNMFDIFT